MNVDGQGESPIISCIFAIDGGYRAAKQWETVSLQYIPAILGCANRG